MFSPPFLPIQGGAVRHFTSAFRLHRKENLFFRPSRMLLIYRLAAYRVWPAAPFLDGSWGIFIRDIIEAGRRQLWPQLRQSRSWKTFFFSDKHKSLCIAKSKMTTRYENVLWMFHSDDLYRLLHTHKEFWKKITETCLIWGNLSDEFERKSLCITSRKIKPGFW